MVKVISKTAITNTQGETSFALKVQGEVEAIHNRQTGGIYLVARTCLVPTLLDEVSAEALVGTEISGEIQMVGCDPYKCVIQATGEEFTFSLKYEYLSEEEITLRRPTAVDANPFV